MGRGFQGYINYQAKWGVNVIVEDGQELQTDLLPAEEVEKITDNTNE